MKFYVRKFTFYLITLWAAISLNFLLPRLIPGDPATILISKMFRAGNPTQEQINAVLSLLGGTTDMSLWEQYIDYWQRIFTWDLGISFTTFTPVTELIGSALPWTLGLVGLATIISFLIGIIGGAVIGWKRGTWLDHVIPATTLMQSIPYFWVAMVMVFVFSTNMGWFPNVWAYDAYGFTGPEWSWDFIKSVIHHGTLPAITIIISAVGGWLLGMRNMMVSTLSEDFITTAEAKGLRPRRIMWAYTVRNAVMPSIAGFAISLAFVVAGSVVMEQVFSYPGIGKLLISSVRDNDFALMQGVFLVITLTVLVANFLMDMFYGLIDPRARHNA